MSVNGCTPQKSLVNHVSGLSERPRMKRFRVSATKTSATKSYASSKEDFHPRSLRNAGRRAPLDRMLAITDLVWKHSCLTPSPFYPQLCRRRSFDGSTLVYGHLSMIQIIIAAAHCFARGMMVVEIRILVTSQEWNRTAQHLRS